MEEKVVAGVKVFPPFLYFTDVVVGAAYRQTVTVRNISSSGKKVAFYGPQSQEFKVIVTNPGKAIAPGLQLTATVEYYPSRNEDVEEKLLICVDNDIFYIPLLGFIPCCLLEIDSEVDFGIVTANGRVISRDVNIFNHGSCPGAFKIKLKEKWPIKIEPCSGIVEPKTVQIVKVELFTDKPQLIDENTKVKLQGQDDAVLKVKGSVIEQRLELFNGFGERLECLNFGPLYFGTAKVEHALLYNNGPEVLSWVALFQDDAIGTELGIDLQKGADSTLHDLSHRTQGPDICSLITCFPNQGSLLPFQKIAIMICFSPRQNEEEIMMGKPPSQQDYALFLKFEQIGCKSTLLNALSEIKQQYVELAVTGSGVPVTLNFSREKTLKFKTCLLGERIDTLCTLKNESKYLPLTFKFRKISHFNVCPVKAKIQPGGSQDVIFSFAPHQVGTFKMKQVIEFIDVTADEGFLLLKKNVFFEMALRFSGVCKPVTNKVMLKLNPGITPEISNATGCYVHVAPDETGNYIGSVRASMANATQIKIHSHQKDDKLEEDVLVAFPNDRYASIRPSDRQKKYRTIFTKIDRYTYVDPDFAFTDEEEAERQVHKELYAEYIKGLREQRINKEKQKAFEILNNPVDIGIKSACGLAPPKVSVRDLCLKQPTSKVSPLSKGCLLTTQELAAEELRSFTKEFTEGLNAVPTGPQEKSDCSLMLTPKQLHQLAIGPPVIDFGEVCMCSISEKQMHIINNLPAYIWVQLEIDCKELQQTSPLSHVVPPNSKTRVPVVLETTTLGEFKKSIAYTVNTEHTGHLLVIATVVPLALELSTEELILRPIPGLLIETGFRTTVTLYNRRNHPADFSWKPKIREKGIAFSIRPARGTVEAFRDLECEVVWHPGFSSPEEGDFSLFVHNGNALKLKCIAELGPTNVQLADERLLFAQTPLGLTTCKTTFLQNKGQNHAYFQLLDMCPLAGMTIVPSHGVVPIGGFAKIDVFFTPLEVFKFDTKAEVAVRNLKALELKLVGFVTAPDIDISVKEFYFPTVPVNSVQKIPFILQNNSAARSRVEFDFSTYSDFSVICKDLSDIKSDPQNPNQYTLHIEGKKALECALMFSPKEVAAYDLSLPVSISGLFTEVSPISKPNARASGLSTKQVPNIHMDVPLLLINATGSRQLLSISTSEIVFDLPSGFCELSSTANNQNIQMLKLHNTSKQSMTWKIDLGALREAGQHGVFKFSQETGMLGANETSTISVSFKPPCPGKYSGEVSIVLPDEPNLFKPIRLCGSVKAPTLTFDPPLVILMPVPLDSETGEVITIIPLDYFRESALRVEIPEIELEDNDRISPLSLQFLTSQVVAVSSAGRSPALTCQINFKSLRPVSFLANIAFIDEDNRRFILQVAAASENCLLTLYPYIAFYHSEQQVILKCGYNGSNGKTYNTGEAVLHPCYVPGTPSRSTSSSSLGAVTSTFFEDSLSDPSYENIETGKTKNDEADDQGQGKKERFELLFFPEEDSEEWIFFQKVVSAIQMWFSLFGWSDGSNPVSIPQSLRSGVYKTLTAKSDALKIISGRETRTIYDMLLYLSGHMLPGITASQSLPSDDRERVVQLHWQHATLLTFLKIQGASLPHVLPEFLFEPQDYKIWMELQAEIKKQKIKTKTDANPAEEKSLIVIDDHMFESVSKRVWTDVLLQVYKVLVLSRVSAHRKSSELFDLEGTQSIPRIKSDPLSSNIYSTSERVILTWLNTHYEKTRKDAWRHCQKGGVPPMRWIVNFDKDLLDGLVLGALLAAYCPFLIPTHIVRMYTKPDSPEQCLHNCLIVVNAFREIGLEIDVQATDICDANPIMMLILCIFLYEKLPPYFPEKTVEFHGHLHSSIVRQVQVKNPSSKILVYNCKIVGRDASDFLIYTGNTIIIRPKNYMSIKLAFKGRFLHSAEATLLLVSSTVSGAGGATVAFSLKSVITKIMPTGTLRCDSPCYELKDFNVVLSNPFKNGGEFKIILVESANRLMNPEELKHISQELLVSSPVFRKSSVDENKTEFTSYLPQFFCSVQSLYLHPKTATLLEVSFLPFALGIRYCTILLSNEEIGEFLYLVEGTGTLPFPSSLIPTDSPNLLPVSNAVPGHLRSQPIQYFKCTQNGILEEKLKIPLINESREKALAIAAQKQMSALEYERRKVTGTLQSSSVRAAVAALGLAEIQTQMSPTSLERRRMLKSIEYSVALNVPKHFETVSKLSIPVSAAGRFNLQNYPEEMDHSDTGVSNSVFLPIKFIPVSPGRYPCCITLRSFHDVRVYKIECVVNSSVSEVEFQFTTPANQSVIQNIPICNMTQQDWTLKAFLEGVGFFGPAVVVVQAGKSSYYPLMFKPLSECCSMGILCLQNEIDGVEHTFRLKGIGLSPPPLDHIVIDCEVRKTTTKVLAVPNHTDNPLTFKVISDLPMIIGKQSITIAQNHVQLYPLNVAMWKHGEFKGVISFVEDTEHQQSPHDLKPKEAVDKQGLPETFAEIKRNESRFSPYKVWFTLEINCIRGPPEKTVTVNCTALDTVGIKLPITNPTNEVLHLDVLIKGAGLKGAKSLTLQPIETINYVAKYSPASTGTFEGSILFQSEAFGEFWYALEMISEKPAPTTLPELECELGKWTRQCIQLPNPTDETLELKTENTNPGNFTVEIDPRRLLLLVPHSTLEVPVQFYPSALGRANHSTSIIFRCPQLEEWIFHLSGVGLIPEPMEPSSISTPLGSLSSIFLNFKNPTDERVLINILLTDQELLMHHLSASVLRQTINKESAFCIPLKELQGILLSPKEKLDIPVMFSPDIMKSYEVLVVVHMEKENGEDWEYDLENLDKELKSVSHSETGGIRGIRWLYPVHGIPEAAPMKPEPAVILCQARNRTEERIEVLLTGSVAGQASVYPSGRKFFGDGIQDEVQVTEGFSTTEEFLYEIQYESSNIKSHMESSVAVHLVRKDRNAQSGVVTLVFNIIFSPIRPMKHSATLMVQSATGGIWKFPVVFIATEAIVDDVINIEAVGVNKESMVGFRLTSQTRYPELFNAYFLPGSDLEFAVSPQAGELLPLGTSGTMITVGFKPSLYSKKHKATLVIQTSSMQWTYEINGLPPLTVPPTNVLAKTDSRGQMRSTTVQQRNFIRENMKLITTAVSSPIKGAPLILRTK